MARQKKMTVSKGGRVPGVYGAQGRRLSAQEAREAARKHRAVAVPLDGKHWLDPPDWWCKVRPIRWLTVSVAAVFVVQTLLQTA